MTEPRTGGTRSTASKATRPRPKKTEDDASAPRRSASTAKATARREADGHAEGRTGRSGPRDGGRTLSASRAAALAAAQVRELTGRPPEGVTALERHEDGWRITIEVLESRRIPDTTDLLALYSVDLDADGELVGYRRERRYHRGRPEENA